MQFDILRAIETLSRTPRLLTIMLAQLPVNITRQHEDPNTWSAFDVVGHLIICEETNFASRILLIMSQSAVKVFKPMDMTAQFERNKGKDMASLLQEFHDLRMRNLEMIENLTLNHTDLQKEAHHPVIGSCSLLNVFAAWVAHDHTHLAQVNRILAKQYKIDVGPFITFLPSFNT